MDKELKDLEILSKKEDKTIVCNAGLVNAGKSSFFNALINSTEDEFKVGAARKTIDNKVFDMTNNIRLIDTPGIDVNDGDTKKAFESFIKSDVILFLHNIKNGDLVRAEYEFINELSKCFSKDELWKRMVFIITWIDEKDKDNDYKRINEKIKKQLIEICGAANPNIIGISAKRYLKGIKENKNTLVSKSNINETRDLIIQLSENMREKKDVLRIERLAKYRKRIEKERDILLSNLNEKKSNLNYEYQDELENIEYTLDKIRPTWNSVKIKKANI